MSDIVMNAVTTPPQRPVFTICAAFHSRSASVLSACIKASERTASGDLAIVDIARGAEARALVGLSEEHLKLAAGRVRVNDVALVYDPIVLGRIPTEVRGV